MSMLKLPLLVDLQQKVGKLVISITSCASITTLENILNWCIKKFGYVNYKHQYNIPPIHLHALLDVRNFTKRSECAPTTYEVVNYCLKFEEH
jgi:hypothetical protein